jgi:formylglycine-generating enzyme required for sulfatase activity
MSESESLEQCYELQGCHGVIGDDFTCEAVEFRGLSCKGYRLPTEAEWEWAALGAKEGSEEDLDTPAVSLHAIHAGNSQVDYSGGEQCYPVNPSDNLDVRNGRSPSSDDGEGDGGGGGGTTRPPGRCGIAPVASLESNVWGLFDMHGNLSEWVHDRYDIIGGAPLQDPTGSVDGRERTIKGCSWVDAPAFCMSALRTADVPSARFNNVGFRPVRSLR